MGETKHAALPYHELEEAKLSTAFYELAMEESVVDMAAVKTACDASHERQMKRLRREYRRIRLGAAVKKTARQVSKAAVFLIFTAAVAGGIAVASNRLLRAKLFEIVVDYTNSGHRIEMYGVEIGEIDLPEGWWAPFYHSYVPEGYVLKEEKANYYQCYQAYYKGEEYLKISYTRSSIGNTTVFTEGCEITEVKIGDNIATMISRDENVFSMFWFEGEIRIMADFDMSYDEAIKIMENIVPIDIEELTEAE